MKIKTFILTFLIMSCPFLFGQQTGANYDWGDAPSLQNNALMIAKLAQIDGVTDYSNYEIGAFCGDAIRGKARATQKGDFYLTISLQNATESISFRLYDHAADLEIFNVYETMSLNEGQHIGSPGNSENVFATYVAKIGNAAYPTIEEAIAAAQVGETVTILKGNYTQDLDINKAITVEGERNDQDENLVNITGKLNITANNATVKNLNVNNGGSTAGYINANNVTVDGCTVVGGNGFRYCYTTGLVTFKNSTITGSTYGIHFDGSAGGEIEIDNCVITGWTSFASTITKVTMKGTSFEEGNYNYVRFYQNEVVIYECIFNENMAIDIAVDGNNTTIDNCTFENGNIEDLFEDKDIVNSTIIVDGTTLKREASIGNTYYETFAEAYNAAQDGETITLLNDITLSEKFVIAKSITLDGNGKTLTYTGNGTSARAIDVPAADGVKLEVTIKNLTVDCTSSYCQRGINYNEDGKLTLEGVTVKGTNVTYALNLPGSSDGAEVKIENSSFTGNIALNVWGENTTINAKNSNFTSVDKAEHENYSAIAFNNDGTTHCGGTVVRIDGGSIIAKDENDEPSRAVRNSANVDFKHSVNNETTIVGTIDIPVAVVTYNGYSEFYSFTSLQSAINKAANDANATVKLISNIELSELVKVEGKVVIDLNGKTVKANCKKAFEVYANATIKNGTIWSQQRCVDTRKNVELTLADVTLEAPTYYSTHQNQQPLTIGGSEHGTKVTMTDVNINAGTIGYAIISYVKTDLTATDSYLSGYSALYVKEGSEGSEFNFVGSTLKGDLGSNDVEDNSFATIATEADDVTVTLDANSKLKSYGQNHLAISVESVDNEITVTGVIEATNFLDGSTNVNANTIKVKAEYAGKLLAEGYVTTADDNGLVKVSGLAVAKIGETYYATLDEAFAAAQNGNEVKILVAGTYALNTSGKNIAITGAVDGVVFDNIGAKNMGSANVTFNHVTFDYYPNVNYTGLQHSGNLTYNNCTINGQVFLYGTSEEFNGCTFNQNSADAYNVWTYGAAQVAFNGCTFNSAGKSVLIYAEGANIFNDVTVTGCTFNASEAVKGKAAIEMDSSLSGGIKLTIDGETTAVGFGSGNVSGNSLWNNKKDNETEANNDITVVVNGVTVLEPWAPVAKIGETPYETLAKAISAATASQTITICSDVNENVTINKNLTIDGGDNKYTGTMTGNAGLTVTVQNLNFVNAWFDKFTKSTTGTYVFKNCSFDGYNATQNYAFRFKGASSVTIENCTVKDYLYSFLYVTSSTTTVNIKNVTVEDCPSYGVYFSSGVTNTSIENLTVKNSNNGFVINNTANRTLNLKDCKFENVTTAINHSNGTNTVKCNLSGENDFGTSASSQYAKYVLADVNATLTAPEGLKVTTSVVNSLVKYENGVYVVKPAVAKIGETYYETLTEAINAADDGATIQLLPVTINEYVAPWATDTQHTSEKSITIVGSKDDEGKLATTLTAGMYLGYDDSQCREHTIVVKDVKFEGKGLKVACQQNVTIEGNQFNDITEGQAIAVVGKNINSVVKDNVINNVAAAQGIELRNTLTATVEGNIISNTGHNALQITSQVGATASKIDVINNTMSNWGKGGEGRAMRINDIVTANINGNVMSHTAAPEEFIKVTGSTTLDASENYWNGVSPLTDGMFTGVEGDLVPVLKSYYTDAEKQNLVVLSPSVAKIGEEYYPSLAAAITAAQQDNTITLLADIAEDVTINNKRLTIDGGGFNSTGLISTNITTAYPLTFQNFNIDGASSYFVKVTGGGGNYIFDNCNIKNSSGLIYTNKSTNIVTIKNLTVEDCSCAVNFVYLNTATFENVNLVNTQYGIHVRNNSAKTINIKGCDLNTENPLYIQNKSNSTITFQFEGVTDVNNNELALYNYGNLVFTTADAKLINAQEGLVVTTTVEGSIVEYEEGETEGFGTYSVIPANVELVRGETSVGKFATIQDAIDAAQDNDKIVVLKDVDLSTNQFVTLDNSYNTYFKVDGKAVTIDLNGKTISGEYAITSPWLVGVFSTENNGHLTLEDNVGTAKVEITGENGEVYALIVNYESGCSITINGGTYKLDKAKDSHMYTGCNEGIIVNGGTFQLGNSGTGSNGQPWMFNAKGQNAAHVIVNGGTFNTDILHQYYAFEVSSARENALVYNESEKTWTVVKDGAVAYVEERYTTFSSGYSNEVGYATLADAVAAANKYDKNGGWLPTITLLANVELDAYVTISESVNLNLDQFNITRVDGTALYVNGEGIEVTINGKGTVSGTQAVYVDNGTVTINGGNYVGAYEAVYVINNGHAVINGGTFGAENDEDDTDFVLNEYDATRDVTTIAVYGGTFHGFNPENNAAEGANTNFCAEGYGAVETAAGSNVWEVMPVQEQSLVKGWKWYSSYIDINGVQGLKKMENALGTNGIQILGHEGFTLYDSELGWYGPLELTGLDVKKMYKIEVGEGGVDMRIAGNIVDFTNETIEIKNGFNWISYPFNQPMNLNDALEGFTPAEGDYIVSHFSFAFYYDNQWQGPLESFTPGEGYIYERIDVDTELSYNVSNTRGAVKANVTTDGNKWMPNGRLYPNNMTMIAVVDGLANANYEVAAFVNGELRGSARPIYIESLDAYMLFLTIHGGDEVEEMSFRLYDIDNDTEYDLSDRINYSNNAHLGSVREPYVFSRGTTGIGEASMSEVNIYPNPTTTGTEINLEAKCEKVEVFNALGVKVAEYQNVDSIDALETAGIYVIRITNNGNVQNCRLVVK